jgi:hypothetical protein
VLAAVAHEGLPGTAADVAQMLAVVPRAVARLVARRLGGFPAAAVELAGVAAVLGDGSPLAHAAAVLEIALREAGAAAAALVAADILRRDDPLEFRHPIVRAAVYDSLDAGTRAHLHRRAAEALVASHLPPEHAASHLLHVPPGADPFVVRTLRAAARRAAEHGAHEASAGQLRRALAEQPAPDERFALLLDLGLAERRLGASGALDHLDEAVRAAPDRVSAARASLELGRTLFHAERRREALDV